MTGPMGQQLAMQDCRTEVDAMSVARQQAARSRARHAGQQRTDILTRVVELDVIPHLLRAHGAGGAPGAVPLMPPAVISAAVIPAQGSLMISSTQVSDLVSLVLDRGEPAAVAFVEAVHDKGALAETIYLDLLAPVARRLGEMWENDTCDFTEVTIGLWRLQNTMRELSPVFLRSLDVQASGPRIVLVPLPGEAHSFGLSMVHEFFSRAGWDAWTGPVDSSADLRRMVKREWVDVIGFSLVCDDKLDTLRTEIAAVRRVSSNPALGVMVGGPGFTANPHLAAQVGADGTATDGLQAVLQAQALVDRVHQESPHPRR